MPEQREQYISASWDSFVWQWNAETGKQTWNMVCILFLVNHLKK
jgi:hypothetical protein